ncbi:MAG TPA: hypothetical protein VHI13_05030 [Candidatus Kapabacteria bacterium]|nr:hypothetical protein [Candidatus Kapabacteria bacterium]
MIVDAPSEDRFHDLQAPGSYEWSYFDGLADDGETGFVAIWFRGCPMSPYYGAAIGRGSRRPERAPLPADHCAFSISLYRRGRRLFSILEEGPGREFVHRDADVRYGTNAVRSDTAANGMRCHIINVDAALALGRARLVGDIEINALPSERIAGPGGRVMIQERGGHFWVPASLDGRFTARLDLWRAGRGMQKLRFSGRAYHDRNAGSEPLSALGADWHWGRLHAGDRTFVWFQVRRDDAASPSFGRLLLLERGAPIAGADAWRLGEPAPKAHWSTLPRPRSIRGVAHDGRLAFNAVPRFVVDSGPFYHRMIARIVVEHDGAFFEGDGITEYLRPSRLAVAAFRPFVKFRVRRRK